MFHTSGLLHATFSVIITFLSLTYYNRCYGNPEAKRLYEDLLIKNNYNKLIRPVSNNSHTLVVYLGLKLSQLIDVDEKNQIMTTNVWLRQAWKEMRLTWNPLNYNNITEIHFPSPEMWKPDVVLFNNADGNYEVTLMTKATLHYTGKIIWEPPAIYKSSCQIDVEFFPFDQQLCTMKFGSWTYDGFQVDLKHIMQVNTSYTNALDNQIINYGIDLENFYKSVEWDVLKVPAKRNERFYPCCVEPYPDITFNITLRRKTLFYTVNLIIPCVAISFLTVLVFYLPSDSGEKVTLSISILLALTVFFLLLAEIIPPTSLVVPLIGKYLLFTMILVTLSIIVTVIVLNVHFRSPATHRMTPWVQRVFLDTLPRILMMRRPNQDLKESSIDSEKPNYVLKRSLSDSNPQNIMRSTFHTPYMGQRDWRNLSYEIFSYIPKDELFCSNASNFSNLDSSITSNNEENDLLHATYTKKHIETNEQYRQKQQESTWEKRPNFNRCKDPGQQSKTKNDLKKALEGVQFIASHMKKEDTESNIKEDWKFVAMVLDRLFLWIFSIACILGTLGIILQAPSLYDRREALTEKNLPFKSYTQFLNNI